jgi:phosphopantetheinyl transferase
MKDQVETHCLNLPGAPRELQAVAAIGESTSRRGLAPHELERLFDYMLAGCEVVRDVGGQPVVHGSSLHISLSHAEGLTALALAPFPVGIDIERIDPEFDVLEFDPDLFGIDDFHALETCETRSRRDHFYRLWTLKEAHLKRQGRNLLCGPLPNVSGASNASTAWIVRPTGRYCVAVSWQLPITSGLPPRPAPGAIAERRLPRNPATAAAGG